MSTATQQRSVGSVPMGGAYPSDQNPDGTWNVRDVPVFASHTRAGKRVNRVWLERAVARAQAQQAAGYLAPLHVAHHGSGQSVERGGYFLPRRVQVMSFGGAPASATMIADFLNVPADVYERMKRGELPYRSVEIADMAVPEIASLALLDHDAPYFKFPLLSIGSERANAIPVPVQAGAFPRFLFSDQEGQMATQSKAAKYADMAGQMAKAKEAMASAMEAFTTTITAMTESVAAMAAELGGSDAPAVEEAPEEEAPAEDPLAAGENLAPAEAAAQAAPVPVAASAMNHETAVKFAAMAGEIAALRADAEKAKRAKTEAETVAAAVQQLAPYVPGDSSAEIRKHYKAGGSAAVSAYVSGITTHATPVPPETFTGDLALRNEPAEVTAYAMAGPQKLAEARRLSHMYSQVPSARTAPLANFLAANLGPLPAANTPNTSASAVRS